MSETPRAPAWITIEQEAGPATKEALRLLWLQMNKPAPTIPDIRFIGAPIETGMVVAYAGAENPNPAEYAICDGHEESRMTRAALFARIRDRYGIGDGSTTFNVPDYRGRAIVGVDPRDGLLDTVGEAGGSVRSTLTVPAHTHGVTGTVDAAGTHSHTGSGSTSNDFTGADIDVSVDTDTADSDAIVPITVVTDVSVTFNDAEHDHTFSFTSSSDGSHQHNFSATSAANAAVTLNVTAPHVTGLFLIKY